MHCMLFQGGKLHKKYSNREILDEDKEGRTLCVTEVFVHKNGL